MSREITEGMSRFSPKSLEGHASQAALLDFVRRVIVDAAPKDVDQARHAGTHLAGFAVWHLDNGGQLLHSEITDGRIEEYLDATFKGRPVGSRDAARSFLRRCRPGSALGSRVAPALVGPAIKPGLQPNPQPSRVARKDPPRLIDEAIDSFRPGGMSAEDWERIAEPCSALVRLAQPRTTARAATLLRELAWLFNAEWTPGADPEELLRPARVQRYFEHQKITGSIRDTARCAFTQIHAAIAPDFHWTPSSRGLSLTPTQPYSDDQVERFFRSTDNMRAPSRKAARALLIVGAGTGVCRGSLPGQLTTDHVEITDNGAAIRLPIADGGLLVPLREPWASRLTELVSELPEGDHPLLGGRGGPNRIYEVASNFERVAGSALELPRLQDHWLLTVLSQPVCILAVLAVLQVTGLTALEGILPYLPPVDASALRTLDVARIQAD